ncbi:unnamed protein product [Adineta ricciae]|uniref:Uncharacterized protein n=1 Tax=Adineta ricciae TaxID=249248 RepID=A0A814EJG3_ADIRI|nr:unnamed protein product [Adineta ricciae]CAF1278912.1 unnamed protein product [Adineta ricciae]
MATSDAHSLQRTIRAAIRSLYPSPTREGSIVVPTITGGNSKSLALYPINVRQIYHSSLVLAVSAIDQNIPGEYPDGPLGIDITCLNPEFDHVFKSMRDIGVWYFVENKRPVSYHGTEEHNALDIVEEDYKLSKHKRFLHGKGIYSSPAPKFRIASIPSI